MAAVAAVYPELQRLNTEVLAISTDSVFSHKVFKETSPSMKNVTYPLLSDRTQDISRAYRVLDEETGATFRASVFINPEKIITAKLIYPREVGRNLTEHVRMMEAIQFAKETGQGAPADWVPGRPGLKREFSKIGRI